MSFFTLQKQLQQKRRLCLFQPAAVSPSPPWIFHGGGHTRSPGETTSSGRSLSGHTGVAALTQPTQRRDETQPDENLPPSAARPPHSSSLTHSLNAHQLNCALIESPECVWTLLSVTEPPKHNVCCVFCTFNKGNHQNHKCMEVKVYFTYSSQTEKKQFLCFFNAWE